MLSILRFISSMPSQYVDNNSGDVVIMVPNIESEHTDSMIVGSLGEQSVCIETEEAEIEPSSPKTMTESSSKCKHFNRNTMQMTMITP